MLGTVRVLFCLAFYWKPGKGCGSKDREIWLEGTHMGGGEGERDVEEGEESEGQGEWKEGMGNTYSEADMCVCLQRWV